MSNLPLDAFEDDIVAHFSRVGPIFQIRMKLTSTAKNRGFCFIAYEDPQSAERALSLNGSYFRNYRKISVTKYVENRCLIVKGIPPKIEKQEVVETLKQYLPTANKITVEFNVKNPKHGYHNFGYAVVDFNDHEAAVKAKKSLQPNGLILWNKQLSIQLSDSVNECDGVNIQIITPSFFSIDNELEI